MEYTIGSFPGVSSMAPVEFQRALQKGHWEMFLHGIFQRSWLLMSFEDVKNKTNLIPRLDRGRQEIRLDQVTGSLGKHQSFTRSLWPLSSIVEERWVNIYELMLGSHGCPPIEVYQVKDSYFILDGHHRASVARAFGNETIEAKVIEWQVLPT